MTNLQIDLEIQEKTYQRQSLSLPALQNFSLALNEGERIAIVGESGVGKSTLLNILGLVDLRFRGYYRLFGRDVTRMSESEIAVLRNESLGFVLQESALINTLTIRDNVTLPALYSRSRKQKWKVQFEELVESLGITAILDKKPLECSGGEKARAVFARAVLMKPKIVLADEPTASLDADNRDRMMKLLFDLNRNHGITVVTVTHDIHVAEQHDKVLQLKR